MERIAVFARRPVTGRVKTRLSPALPARLACELYTGMLIDALAAARASRADEHHLFWAGPPAEPERDSTTARAPFASPDEFIGHVQVGRDLGERMRAAFERLIVDPADRAVVIGADCPALSASHIDAAFAALAQSDVVLGPAKDGGYYLIGLRRVAPALFRNVEWSTGAVLDQTRSHAHEAGLRVSELEPLDDVDTAEALLHWMGEGARGDATRAALARMGLRAASD